MSNQKMTQEVLIGSFSSDLYKYKVVRLNKICNVILKLAGMTNAVVGGVVAVISVFV